jgi:hypothetical protein
LSRHKTNDLTHHVFLCTRFPMTTRFGKLKVVSLNYFSINSPPKYLMRCDCNKVCAIIADQLTSGEVTSCGCDSSNVSQKRTTFTCRNLTLTVREWSEYLGINKNTLRSRLRRGWDLERAFFTEVRRKTIHDPLAQIFFEAMTQAA